jgi:hypothetical protein
METIAIIITVLVSVLFVLSICFKAEDLGEANGMQDNYGKVNPDDWGAPSPQVKPLNPFVSKVLFWIGITVLACLGLILAITFEGIIE